MVSLARSINTNSGGATFFSESGMMEDRGQLEPILASYGIFKPLRTVLPFVLHLSSSLAIEILALVYVFLHPNEQNRCKEYFIVIYAQAALWFLTFVVDQYVRAKHYTLRMNGYLEFYRETYMHHRLPFYVVSLINALLIVIQGVIQQIYKDEFEDKCLKGGPLSPIGYLSTIISFQFVIVGVSNMQYILKVRRFNYIKPPPDVQKEDWNACSSRETFCQGEVGYRQLGDKMFDFLEKQADLIRHLKDHNERLGQRLMMLTAQLQARNSNIA